MTTPNAIEHLNTARTIEDLDRIWKRIIRECGEFAASVDTDDAQRTYKSRAKELHPDAGGSEGTFNAMKERYELWCSAFAHYTRLRRHMAKYIEHFSEKPIVPEPLEQQRSFGGMVLHNLSKKKTRRRMAKSAGTIIGDLVRSAVDGALRKRR